MAKAISMTIQVQGAEVWINYNESNNRITSVEWTLPSGVVARAQIWDTDIDPVTPIFDQSYGGPQSGSQNVPGQYRMVQVTDDSGVYMDLPPNILWKINVQTIG